MGDFVAVGSYNSRVEAETAKGFLEANGIKVEVSADDLGGAEVFPFQPSSTGVRLLVLKKDFQKAERLLK
jgi:hypothetical protein